MTRRDAGTILWAAAGTYALYSVGWLVAVYGRGLWTAPGSVLGEESLLKINKAIFDLTVILLTLTGIALLRWRVALAAWLFREPPRPAAPAGSAAPGEAAAERIFALDLCALVAAAVAIRLIVVCIGDLGAWAYLSVWATLNPFRWLRPGTARGLAPLLVLAAGALLLARRNRVAAWVLRGSSSVRLTAASSDVQRTGLRLFGLMLIFGQLPNLATRVGEDLCAAPAGPGEPRPALRALAASPPASPLHPPGRGSGAG
jgi:hypothetical protein